MATSQFRRHPPTHKAHEDALREELNHVKEVLRRYRHYVEEKLEVDLANTRDEAAAAASERDALREENDALKHAAARLQREARDAQRDVDRCREQMAAERDRLAAQHDDHLMSARQAAAAEAQRLRQQLEKAEAEAQQLRSQGMDRETRRRVESLTQDVADLQEENRQLRQRQAQQTEALAEAHGKAVELSPVAATVAKTLVELAAFTNECYDFHAGIVSAFQHSGVDLGREDEDDHGGPAALHRSPSSDASPWRSTLALSSRLSTSRSGNNTGGGDAASSSSTTTTGSSSDIRDALQTLTSLIGAIRKAAHQDRAIVAASVKTLIVKHADVLATVARKDHEHQQERDLHRRRMAELEEDRRQERETLMQMGERERMRQVLANPLGGGGGDGHHHHATVALPGQQGGAAMAGAGAAAAAATASPPSSPRLTGASDASHRPGGGGGSGGNVMIRVPMRSSACQTGPELMGSQGDQMQFARLSQEIHNLQVDLTQHKETIQLMEKQRSLFMTFVEDEQVAREVQTALGYGDVTSEQFMMHGIAPGRM